MKGFKGRAIKRDKVRIRAKIECMGIDTGGAILDLTEDGICLYTAIDIPLAFGDKINVMTDEMGLLVGTIRWIRRPHVGAQLVSTSNNRAKVASYYKIVKQAQQLERTRQA